LISDTSTAPDYYPIIFESFDGTVVCEAGTAQLGKPGLKSVWTQPGFQLRKNPPSSKAYLY